MEFLLTYDKFGSQTLQRLLAIYKNDNADFTQRNEKKNEL